MTLEEMQAKYSGPGVRQTELRELLDAARYQEKLLLEELDEINRDIWELENELLRSLT